MYISRVQLKNWRNFVEVDVPLRQRQFLVGPNASGKSNFLDVFRFLRDIAKPDGGGLQRAVNKRGGLSKIRCLNTHSKRASEVFICIHLSENGQDAEDDAPQWTYRVGIKQEKQRSTTVVVSHEEVCKNGESVFERPSNEDSNDPERLKQTHLEQVNENKNFRVISDFLSGISYMHLVPQLLRHSEEIQGNVIEDDPFGQGLLQSMQNTNKGTRDARLRKISSVIRAAVPNMEEIRLEHDQLGKCHIAASYANWRSRNAKLKQEQLSDGTLRLIGLVWSLLEQNTVLLLEEPELSLHSGIVENLAGLLHKAQKGKKPRNQIFISTHSAELLSDKGIAPREVLMLGPSKKSGKSTEIRVASEFEFVEALLNTGETIGDIVIPSTKPENHEQLAFDI